MTTRHLFVVDSGITNYMALIQNLPTGSEWALMDNQRDGLLQLQEILANYQRLDSIQILSHGSQGSLQLGTTTLNSWNIQSYADALTRIGSSLVENGDILLYGCDVGSGTAGALFVERLAQVTGADVAASTNATGAAALGGDWVLEMQSGTVESTALDDVPTAVLLAANTAPTLTISTAPATSYEIEYNDDRTFATAFTSAAIGSLSGPNDVDWYAVRLDAPGQQTFIFDVSTLDFGLWNVNWYDSRMQLLSGRSSGPSSGTATGAYEIPAYSTGTYYIQVRATDPGLYNGGLYNIYLSPPDQSTYTDTEADDTFAPKFGRLIGNDIDTGTTLSYGVETGTDHGSTVSAEGNFGKLTVTKTSGLFTYTPENGAIEGLKNNAIETFTMTVSDGTVTTSATYTLSIAGADDPTIFGGTFAGVVSEDGPTTASGTLTANDRDIGDAAIAGQSDTVGTYGKFSVAPDGNWTYALNVTGINVQALAVGQTVTDTFGVQTAGGMTQNIVVTVNGTNDVMAGSSDADTLIGTRLDDQIVGLAGNDTLSGMEGDDTLDGGQGIDTAWFAGIREHFQLNKAVSGEWSVQDRFGHEGNDQLTDIERLKFSDKKFALDLSPLENAGQALEFIGVMAPSMLSNPSIVGLILGLIDGGSSLPGVFQLAIDVGLVNEIAGSSTGTALAQMAFRNVMGAEADAAMTDWLVSFMDGRTADYSPAQFLATIAGLEVNQTQIGLIGLQQTGIEYS